MARENVEKVMRKMEKENRVCESERALLVFVGFSYIFCVAFRGSAVVSDGDEMLVGAGAWLKAPEGGYTMHRFPAGFVRRHPDGLVCEPPSRPAFVSFYPPFNLSDRGFWLCLVVQGRRRRKRLLYERAAVCGANKLT